MNNLRLYQKSTGSFYTPEPLARLLAQEVLACLPGNTDWKQLRILDPAAGEGGLLLPFARELARRRQLQEPATSAQNIIQDILTHQLFAADICAQALEKIPLPATHCYIGNALDATGEKSVLDEAFGTPFDIILANPPYIGQKGHAPLFRSLQNHPLWGRYFTAKNDLLYYFFYLAIHLLKPQGLAGFITPPYFTTAAGAKRLRQTLRENTSFLRLIDFENQHLFQQADPHTLLSVFQKGESGAKCLVGREDTVSISQENLFYGPDQFLQTRASSNHQCLLTNMAKAPVNLGQIAHISNGLMTGCDKAFILTTAEKNALALSSKERTKLRPFFKNSDISAYVPTTQARLWLIDFFYPNDRELDIKTYPHLLAHLAQFKEKLLARKQNNNGIDKQLAQGKFWFGSVRRKMNFEGEKLVLAHRAKTVSAAYSNAPWYASSDVYFITDPQPPYTLWSILGLLNSAPYLTWLQTNGKRKGELLELYSAPLKQLPVPRLTTDQQTHLDTLTKTIYRAIQSNKQAEANLLQQQLDAFVESLF